MGKSCRDPLVVAVDMDGIIVKSAFPYIGKTDHAVVCRLKKIQENGAFLVLNTCRWGQQLDDAVAHCKQIGLEFDAVNANLPHLIERWGECRKIGCDIYIDDRDICFSRGRMRRRLWFLANLYPLAVWYFKGLR